VRYFGDYELQEEIARGGMGVVRLTVQSSNVMAHNPSLALLLAVAGAERTETRQADHNNALLAAIQQCRQLRHFAAVPVTTQAKRQTHVSFDSMAVSRDGKLLATAVRPGKWLLIRELFLLLLVGGTPRPMLKSCCVDSYCFGPVERAGTASLRSYGQNWGRRGSCRPVFAHPYRQAPLPASEHYRPFSMQRCSQIKALLRRGGATR
jgi:hypothetical protein